MLACRAGLEYLKDVRPFLLLPGGEGVLTAAGGLDEVLGQVEGHGRRLPGLVLSHSSSTIWFAGMREGKQLKFPSHLDGKMKNVFISFPLPIGLEWW